MVNDYSQCVDNWCYGCGFTVCECRWDHYGHYIMDEVNWIMHSHRRQDILCSIRDYKEPMLIPHEDCYDEFPTDHARGRTTKIPCEKCGLSPDSIYYHTICKHSHVKDYTYCEYYKGKCPTCKESLCHCRWDSTGHYILNSEKFMDDMAEGNYFYDSRPRCYYCNRTSCRCDGDD